MVSSWLMSWDRLFATGNDSGCNWAIFLATNFTQELRSQWPEYTFAADPASPQAAGNGRTNQLWLWIKIETTPKDPQNMVDVYCLVSNHPFSVGDTFFPAHAQLPDTHQPPPVFLARVSRLKHGCQFVIANLQSKATENRQKLVLVNDPISWRNVDFQWPNGWIQKSPWIGTAMR